MGNSDGRKYWDNGTLVLLYIVDRTLLYPLALNYFWITS